VSELSPKTEAKLLAGLAAAEKAGAFLITMSSCISIYGPANRDEA